MTELGVTYTKKEREMDAYKRWLAAQKSKKL